MHKSVPALVTAAALVLPVGTTFAATTKTTAGATATTRTLTGPVEQMRWGAVQATIIVKGKKITSVEISAPTERPRSAFINQQAVPILVQEVLKAQSANIDLVSGATMTSEAFDLSLQAAIKKARL